jgi:4-amino-4-deoxy-L-arabinose transferase-like glycosyltransferase
MVDRLVHARQQLTVNRRAITANKSCNSTHLFTIKKLTPWALHDQRDARYMTFGSAGLNISGRQNPCPKSSPEIRGFRDHMPSRMIENLGAASFREFLFAHRTLMLLILAAAFAARLVLVIEFPHDAVDEVRYTVPAINMLAGHGFSADVAPPYLPSEHTVPLYPIFIAGVYAVAGQDNAAVRVAQSVVDVITCLLVAFIAFNLAPGKLKSGAAFASLIIYGFLSWFTIFWTRYVLTETLAIFWTVLAVALSIWAMRGARWRWLIVGAICGLALLTRADSFLLVLAFVLFLSLQVVRVRSRQSVLALLLFCVAIPVILAPWMVRNYFALGKFQPLSNAYGRPRGEYVPVGYMIWTRTWMTDESNYHAQDLIFHAGNRDFDPSQLPLRMFDSAEERDQVIKLIAQYNQKGEMTPELSDQFGELANARIKRAPLRYYAWLPLKRTVSMWLTGFVTTNRFHMLIRILLVLPILIGGFIGLAIWARHPVVVLLALIIVTRTLCFGFLSAEARYIVEAYPLVIAGCGLTAAALVQYLIKRSTNQTDSV